MRIDMLPGTTNVVQFPIERRQLPTIDLMRDIAPDVREVMSAAEAFKLTMPVADLRARVDEETARYILEQFADGPTAAALTALLDTAVATAVAASWIAHDQAGRAAEVVLTLLRAETAGGYWLDRVRTRADIEGRRMAELMIEAHTRVEEAEGVARAVGLARRGEAWTPRDGRAEQDRLFTLVAPRAG